VVFIVVQNLVVISAAVSIIDYLKVSIFRAFGLKMPIHAQNWRTIIIQEAQLLLGWPTLLSQS